MPAAKCGEQLPRLELEARQLPQTRKDKFGWPFHDLVYGRFLMPRCDLKHTATQLAMFGDAALMELQHRRYHGFGYALSGSLHLLFPGG